MKPATPYLHHNPTIAKVKGIPGRPRAPGEPPAVRRRTCLLPGWSQLPAPPPRGLPPSSGPGRGPSRVSVFVLKNQVFNLNIQAIPSLCRPLASAIVEWGIVSAGRGLPALTPPPTRRVLASPGSVLALELFLCQGAGGAAARFCAPGRKPGMTGTVLSLTCCFFYLYYSARLVWAVRPSFSQSKKGIWEPINSESGNGYRGNPNIIFCPTLIF